MRPVRALWLHLGLSLPLRAFSKLPAPTTMEMRRHAGESRPPLPFWTHSPHTKAPSPQLHASESALSVAGPRAYTERADLPTVAGRKQEPRRKASPTRPTTSLSFNPTFVSFLHNKKSPQITEWPEVAPEPPTVPGGWISSYEHLQVSITVTVKILLCKSTPYVIPRRRQTTPRPTSSRVASEEVCAPKDQRQPQRWLQGARVDVFLGSWFCFVASLPLLRLG